MKKSIVETVWALAEPLAGELGYLLWDVEYGKEGADYVLRITIDTDAEGGITIDDCETMHRAIDPLLDEADPIEEAYMLAVSSPGVERALTRPEHFVRCTGEQVVLKFYQPMDGTKSLRGELGGIEGDEILLTVDGALLRFPRKNVAKCETVFDW